MNIAPGIELLDETEGTGEPAKKGDAVVYNIKIFLNRGDEVLINEKQIESLRFHEKMIRREGQQAFVEHSAILGKREMIPGIEKSLIGMKSGGYRKVKVGPHLAYRDEGIPDLIPPNALLVIEIWLRDIKPGT